jgi:hypothetical protein
MQKFAAKAITPYLTASVLLPRTTRWPTPSICDVRVYPGYLRILM